LKLLATKLTMTIQCLWQRHHVDKKTKIRVCGVSLCRDIGSLFILEWPTHWNQNRRMIVSQTC
jgi:hypothetical protein